MRLTAIKHGITDNNYTAKRQGGTAPHANEFLRKTNSITEKEKKGGGGESSPCWPHPQLGGAECWRTDKDGTSDEANQLVVLVLLYSHLKIK